MTGEALFLKYEGLIASIAKKVAKSFHCVKYGEYGLTEYSKQLLDDLKSEGTVELLRLIQSKEYDKNKGEFSTYIYPHIKGVMQRYLEKNMGVMSVSKNAMDLIRKIQQDYSLGKPAEEIAEEYNVPIEAVYRYANYNTHFFSVNDAFPDEHAENPYEHMTTKDNHPADKIVNKKICVELLKELFDSLSEKDRAILGHAFGVFGYEKKTLDEIACEEMMKPDGVEKAKKAALKRLKKKYPDSKLKLWQDIYKAVMSIK